MLRILALVAGIIILLFLSQSEGFLDAPDPCAGLTDGSLASSISHACLKKMFLDVGCSVTGTAYPSTPDRTWWNSSPNGTTPVYCNETDKKWPNCGAGNVLTTKNDMKAWATMIDDVHVKGCKGPQCRAVATPFDLDGGGNAVYLDRQNISCRADEALSQFRLVRNPAGTLYQYQYTCCKVPGPAGPQGPAGAQGPKGVAGKDGLPGAQGPQGLQGLQGLPGIAGVPGKIGEKGPKGDQGSPGPIGPQGLQGPAGQDGINGWSPMYSQL